jgi:effector-binding domain-containing protein
MFKIGEFSRLSQVTVKTLRYYDRIGLLTPAEVDPSTNYRYYAAHQLRRLNRILALKGLGLSLDQIAQLLDDELSPEQIRGMLQLKRLEIQERLEEGQARLARVELRLRQIEKEDKMPEQEVRIKQAPAQPVASLRDVIPTYSDIGELFEEMFSYLGQKGVTPSGPPFVIYHDEEFRETDADVEVVVPMGGQIPEGERIRMRRLPEVEEMASVIHNGSYETIGETYGQLMGWIEDSGYQIAGPGREIYLHGPESGDDPSTYVTEIQMPMTKK